MQLKPLTNALKKPDFANGFVAEGRVYRICSQLSVERYIAFLKLEVEAGLGVTFKATHDTFRSIFDLANKPQPEPGRIAVLANDAMLGLENLDKKKIPGLLICCLFLVTEDEDLKVYDPDVMDRKIADWEKEGYEVQSFLAFALSSIEGFSKTYLESSQESSRAENPK